MYRGHVGSRLGMIPQTKTATRTAAANAASSSQQTPTDPDVQKEG
jgi:hypothetical protein